MSAWLWADDQWQPTAGVPLTDRGFRHGMSVFETLRIYRGKWVAGGEHWQKLRQTCAGLGFRQPPEQLLALPPAMEHGMARLYVTAGDGNFCDPLDGGRIFLLIEAAVSKPPSTLSIAKAPHSATLPGLKTGNYWPNVAARRAAAEKQCDEMVLINASGHVISASLANLFAVIDGLLLTPRTSSGARAGVQRDWVLARADVIVSDFHPQQLLEADEIFLTNSGYGIAPILEVEGRALGSQKTGSALRAEYSAWLEGCSE